jgi:hypothetical protein
MNFLLDENFPKSAEKLLSELGHHVFEIRGTELQGIMENSIYRRIQEGIIANGRNDKSHPMVGG